jgi:hypothetical protein
MLAIATGWSAIGSYARAIPALPVTKKKRTRNMLLQQYWFFNSSNNASLT